MRRITSLTAVLVLTSASLALAQDQQTAIRGLSEAQQQALRLKESRYQIGQMERLLEGAVEHGATVIRDRLRALMPSDMLLTENARARGFRLDGYGIFFDVEVPSLSGTLPWSFLTLNQNNLGLDTALRTVRSFVDAAAANDVNLQQALRRLELEVATTPSAEPRLVGSSASAAAPDQDPPAPAYSSLNDINEAYRSEIRDALIDAMLEHSRGLGIPPTEFLTVAARGSDDCPRLAPADTDSRTVVFSVRGADLAAFLAGQISREDARKRVDMRVF